MRAFLITIGVMMSLANLAGSAHADDRYDIGTVGVERCKNGLNMGARASGRYMIACLVKTAATVDLDQPQAVQQFSTVYGYAVHPDLLAKWQANPGMSLGKIDGFTPVRMDNAVVEWVPTNTGGDVFKVYTLSGLWVSANGGEERKRPVQIVIGLYKGYFTIDDVIWN